MSELVKVAVDAMGGDNAPKAIVQGAVDALRERDNLFVYLTGKTDAIQAELSNYTYPKDRLQVVPATEVIETGEPPVRAIRSKKDSSLVVAQGLKMPGAG